MEPDVAISAKVQDMLTNMVGSVTLERKNLFSVRHESARGFIAVRANNSYSFVDINIPVLRGVTVTPELLEYVAFNDDYIFGHLFLERWDDEVVLMFNHKILADYLDEDELGRPLFGMMHVANELDDELQKRFGGHRFHEDA